MQVKLKSGKVLDLSEDEVKEMLHMYKDWSENSFDADKLEHYFEDMHKKAHMNLEMISDETIETEKDLKDSLIITMKYGTRADVAYFIIEAMEYQISKMIIESMK